MKKCLTVLVCIMMVFSVSFSMAETADKDQYTIVSVNGVFNIQGITPDGYKMAEIDDSKTTITVRFSHEDPAKPAFVLIISFLEEYADVERLNELTEEEMMALVDDDPTLSEDIRIMETDYGTKVMILRAKDPRDDFACFVTLYKGYEVGLNLFPGTESNGTLTDEQITQAMKFLSDLDFISAGK